MSAPTMPDFSTEQWEMLAVLHLLEAPVPIPLLGEIVPLHPGPFFELFTQAKALGWLHQKAEDSLTLETNLPEWVLSKFQEVKTPGLMAVILDKLEKLGVKDLAPIVMADLLTQSGKYAKAARMHIQLADQVLAEQKPGQAYDQLLKAVELLCDQLDDKELLAIYIATILKLSDLSFPLNKDLKQLSKHVIQAQKSCTLSGDKRSHTLLQLHLGRLFIYQDNYEKAYGYLAKGLKAAEALGDEDIINQSSPFFALLYQLQGLHKKAIQYCELAEKAYELSDTDFYYDSYAPVLSGFCLSFLGDFHRAVGNFDCSLRSAQQKANHYLTVTLEASLGTMLLHIKRDREASVYLEAALKEAEKQKNHVALRLARSGLALKSMIEGHPDLAHKWLSKAYGASSDPSELSFYFMSPWILETLYEFEQLGFDPIPNMSYRQTLERIEAGANIHLKGTALRLITKEKQKKGADASLVREGLKKSQEYLEQTGDVLQLSKTINEMARLELAHGNKEKAQHLAQKAWRILGVYTDLFFPNDLHHLVHDESTENKSTTASHDSLIRFSEMCSTVLPVENEDDLYTRVVLASNRFFGAERGGLFWFPKGRYTKNPELRAGCNLTVPDIMGKSFEPFLDVILKSFRGKKPILIRKGSAAFPKADFQPEAVYCLPIEDRGKIRWVLYHDNSYLKDCFDFLDPASLEMVVRHLNELVGRVRRFCLIKEERSALISQVSLTAAAGDTKEIIYQSDIMKKLMSKIDRAAKSDSTVLILGDSGVGKELVANRIYSHSDRSGKPFVIVDATTIPEGLFESELFGHEKGSFTGADRQKKGRIELANQGTLFIDEIGELPQNVQVKLLRSIQERCFNRVGGNKTIHSDFRLIVATNRDLQAEVSAGRFREDLYFRLNVIPFQIPPLKDRTEDITLLAQHFLARYTRKYNSPHTSLEPEAKRLLKNYTWPGNVRELAHAIERSVLLSHDERLEINLPTNSVKDTNAFFPDVPVSDLPTLDEMQRRYIQHVLEKTQGRKSGPGGAAGVLGMARTTLNSRMRKLGIL
ncbi:MAG: sigma 54-interacting transcriptional regulator [Deltaproteobacteria bacterium]|nr:sigma 54-interacting transcriptional regulator [Deltaproteobacteria bacterium]